MKHFLTLFALLISSLAFGQESCPNLFTTRTATTLIDIEDFLGLSWRCSQTLILTQTASGTAKTIASI